ncbi:MAG: hypothetical protein IKA36_02945 [Clostridia bacterium]|nr:hypothetical protein [Clostridia bacterium]
MKFGIRFTDLTCPNCSGGKLMLKSNNLPPPELINTHYECSNCRLRLKINWIYNDSEYVPEPDYNTSRLDEFVDQFGTSEE